MLYTKFVLVAACAVGALAAKGGAKGGGKAVATSSASESVAAAAATGAQSAAADANNKGGSVTLDAAVVQTGSAQNGLSGVGVENFEAASQTSNDNFINFCSGKTLTNGLQVVGGSCNGIVMGDVPAKTNMVSSIITNPQTGQTLEAHQDFNITVQMANLAAGSFTNALTTYYSAPQSLKGGIVVGHTHVTVQDLGKSLNPTVALDATQFAFFKGINDAGNGKGLLSAAVAGGLPPGNYRVCTMASASNHQPVLMPVAQRGTPDDCTKFTVAIGGGKGGGAKSAASSAAAASTATAAGKGKRKGGAKAAAADTSSVDAAAAAASASTSATAATAGKGKGKGGAKAAAASTSSVDAAAASASASATAATAGKGNGKFGKREFIA